METETIIKPIHIWSTWKEFWLDKMTKVMEEGLTMLKKQILKNLKKRCENIVVKVASKSIPNFEKMRKEELYYEITKKAVLSKRIDPLIVDCLSQTMKEVLKTNFNSGDKYLKSTINQIHDKK